MSTQKGNATRTRPQKHQNKKVFKNNLHDTSHTTKIINNINVSDVCQRCKDIIEWKIKYKKYKPLTQPKKCVRCEQKKVCQAYHVMCRECGQKFKVCTKCCEAKEVVVAPKKPEPIKLDREMRLVLKTLPERKRRTFLRYVDKINKDNEEKYDEEIDKDKQKEDLVLKLQELKVSSTKDDLSNDFDFSDDECDGDDVD